MRFGGLEILFIFAIILLFFGPKQIPKLTGVIKDSIESFKGEVKDENIDKLDVDKDDIKAAESSEQEENVV